MSQQPPVVIYVGGASYTQPAAATDAPATGQRSGPLAGFPHAAHSQILDRALDPYQVHKAFPQRWQRYVVEQYGTAAAIVSAFQVSERTARKWLAGESGANGGHVAIAVSRDPDVAHQMLFAAE